MKPQSQLKPALRHKHSVLTRSKMAAPHLQIAEQATVTPSLMTQWNEDNDMASITLVRPPATENTMEWEKILCIQHYWSTCPNHNLRWAASHSVADRSQKNFSWMQEASRRQPSAPLYGATTSGLLGALILGKPSMKQLPQTLEGQYKKLPRLHLYTG